MPLRSVPFIVRQLSPTECGIACLSMVCATWGKSQSLSDLRHNIPSGRDGLSGATLSDWLYENGFNCRRATEISSDDGNGNYLYIALMDSSHFVIIDTIGSRSVRIADPALGYQTITQEEFLGRFSGYALRVSPGTRRLASSRPLSRLLPLCQTIMSVREMVRIGGFPLFFLHALIFVTALIPLLSSALTAYVVNLVPTPFNFLTGVWLAVCAFCVGSFIIVLLRNLLSVSANLLIGRRLSHEFIEKTISSSFAVLRNYPGGDLVVRLGSISSIRGFLVHTMMQSILDAMAMLLYSIVLVFTYPPIGLVALGGLAIVGVTGLMVGLKQYSISFSLAKAQADMNSSVFEMLKNIEYVKMASLENTMMTRWREVMSHYYNEEGKVGRRQAYVDVIVSLVSIGFPVIALGACAPLVASGRMSVGLMVGVNTLLGSVFASSRNLLSSADNFYSVSVAISRYTDLVDLISLAKKQHNAVDSVASSDLVDGIVDPGFFKAMELEDIHFCYPGASSFVLKGVSCTVEAGSMIGIIGATGSGKSTLLRVISGVEQPTSGIVKVLRQNNGSLFVSNGGMPRLGVVTQDVALFSGTVRANMLAGSGRTDDGEDDVLWDALDAACLGDEIRSMPMTLDTQLGEGGIGLSGGQKQRLCVARAILSAGEVLIIDEGLSGCDMDTEAKVLTNLRTREMTVVLVTHRRSVVNMCDQVYKLSEGALFNVGSS